MVDVEKLKKDADKKLKWNGNPGQSHSDRFGSADPSLSLSLSPEAACVCVCVCECVWGCVPPCGGLQFRGQGLGEKAQPRRVCV